MLPLPPLPPIQPSCRLASSMGGLTLRAVRMARSTAFSSVFCTAHTGMRMTAIAYIHMQDYFKLRGGCKHACTCLYAHVHACTGTHQHLRAHAFQREVEPPSCSLLAKRDKLPTRFVNRVWEETRRGSVEPQSKPFSSFWRSTRPYLPIPINGNACLRGESAG